MALKAKGIFKSFYTPTKVPIVQNLNLEVARGEAIAIVGKSGQGKSTLLQILGTLDAPCAGSLHIMGKEVSFFNKSAIRCQHLGFIFQSFHLLEDYTALENVLMPAKIARKDTSLKSESFKLACSLLEDVNLKERMHFSAKFLSGGEKQRVAIARALCNNPDIIFADEPSGNLDKETALHIHNLLLSLTKKQNKSLIIVTHDDSLAHLVDTKYTLSDGTLNRNSP